MIMRIFPGKIITATLVAVSRQYPEVAVDHVGYGHRGMVASGRDHTISTGNDMRDFRLACLPVAQMQSELGGIQVKVTIYSSKCFSC